MRVPLSLAVLLLALAGPRALLYGAAEDIHPAAALGVAVPWDDQAAMFSLIGETVMTGSFLVGSAGSCDLVIGRGDILSLLTSEQDL